MSYGDIAIDSQNKHLLLADMIKASKSDPFHKGKQILIGHTGCECWPLTAVQVDADFPQSEEPKVAEAAGYPYHHIVEVSWIRLINFRILSVVGRRVQDLDPGPCLA